MQSPDFLSPREPDKLAQFGENHYICRVKKLQINTDMAGNNGSLRVIKKDIDFIVDDFVENCIMLAWMRRDKNVVDEVNVLMDEAYDLGEDLRGRVNQAPRIAKGESRKEHSAAVKAHFKALGDDMLKGFDGLFDRLSEVAKK